MYIHPIHPYFFSNDKVNHAVLIVGWGKQQKTKKGWKSCTKAKNVFHTG